MITKKKLAEYRIKDLYVIGSTQKLDGMPHGTSVTSPVENEYERIEHLKGLFQEEIDTCIRNIEQTQKFKMQVDTVINTLWYRERTVVQLKYHDHVKVNDIARRMDLSRQSIYNIEARAISYLSTRLNVQIPT